MSFTANQMVPMGLLQPAPAVFYDYYEPGSIFLSILHIILMSSMLNLLFFLCRCKVHRVLLALTKKQVGLHLVLRGCLSVCRK